MYACFHTCAHAYTRTYLYTCSVTGCVPSPQPTASHHEDSCSCQCHADEYLYPFQRFQWQAQLRSSSQGGVVTLLLQRPSHLSNRLGPSCCCCQRHCRPPRARRLRPLLPMHAEAAWLCCGDLSRPNRYAPAAAGLPLSGTAAVHDCHWEDVWCVCAFHRACLNRERQRDWNCSVPLQRPGRLGVVMVFWVS